MVGKRLITSYHAYPTNNRRSPNVGLLLAHRLRHWSIIRPLGERFVWVAYGTVDSLDGDMSTREYLTSTSVNTSQIIICGSNSFRFLSSNRARGVWPAANVNGRCSIINSSVNEFIKQMCARRSKSVECDLAGATPLSTPSIRSPRLSNLKRPCC